MWRTPARTIITMASVFFAVILSVITSSLREGIFDNLIKNVVGFYTGYVQVHKAGYQKEPILDNSFIASETTGNRIRKNENITGITARLESFVLASAGNITKGCQLVGIEPEKENEITFLKNKVVKGKYFEKTDNEVVISEGLAEKLKLKVSDTMILIGQGYHGATAAGKYIIKGIARFGSPDLNDKMIFISLVAAREFYSAQNMITTYVLSLRNTDLADTTARQIARSMGADFEVLSWGEIIPDIRQHIKTDTSNARYVQGVLYILICFGIFGTLLMMMVERRFEMGMLVAIGMKKTKLMILLMIESIVTVIVGCGLGLLASIPLVYYFNRHPLKIGGETARVYQRFGFEPIFPTSLDASIFIRQGEIVLIIGLILSLYPLYKVLRLDPVNAMKK